MAVSSSDVQWYYSGCSSSASSEEPINFAVPSGTISITVKWVDVGNTIRDWFDWNGFINNCPDAKEIINNLHVTIYRKARFLKKVLRLPSEHKRPITNRMMLQRANFRGRMARV